MYKIAGTIEHIGETVQITEKFKTRQLVIRIDGQYPQEVEFKAIQLKTEVLDDFKAFDEVEIDFLIEGRRWEKEDKVNWFNSLVIMSIRKS